MEVMVKLKVVEPDTDNLTVEDIEKDLRRAESDIGFNYEYFIESVEVT